MQTVKVRRDRLRAGQFVLKDGYEWAVGTNVEEATRLYRWDGKRRLFDTLTDEFAELITVDRFPD